MAFENYRIDEKAHNLVQKFYLRGVNNQVFKMRTTVAYGLERFWGEQWRFSPTKEKEKDKHEYWKDVWQELIKTMSMLGITSLPNEKPRNLHPKFNPIKIDQLTREIWSYSQSHNIPNQKQDKLIKVIKSLDATQERPPQLLNNLSEKLWEIPSESQEITADLAESISQMIWGRTPSSSTNVNVYHIQELAHKIWRMDKKERQITQAILLQLCDSLIWWTQRYKKLAPDGGEDNE